MERRTYLKTVGGIASATTIGGVGLFAMSGGAAAQSGVSITANDPTQVSNDRGDLTKVTIDPSFRVEWDNFDTAVGKVMVVIEARTKENGSVQGEGWTPVLRTTPWLTEDVSQNGGPHIDYSKPGTTGYFEITGTLGEALAYASRVRTGNNEPKARPIEVVNEIGRPDYGSETFPDNSVTTESYLNGSSIGGADQTYDVIGDQIVNNFPGADAGYYGAAIDTSNFDVNEDGTSDADTVELRYTIAFYTVNWVTEDWYEGPQPGEGWMEHVRDSDIQTDDKGNSLLVMNGEDGYPDITDYEATSEASNHYGALQSIANDHPSVMTSQTSFAVSVANEQSETSGSGTSNTGAEGGGQ